MKGMKTFIFSGLLIAGSIAAMVLDTPTRWTIPGLGIFIAAGLITLRLGIKTSWDGAYKVYVDVSNKNEIKTLQKPN